MKTIREEARNIPVLDEVDVVVAGGGPAGIIAAIAAARNGAKTLLVENRGFLGGNATLGLPFLGFHGDKKQQLVRGIPWELIERLVENKLSPGPWMQEGKYKDSIISFDITGFKGIVNNMIAESGVRLLLHTSAVSPILEQNSIKGIFVESKSGRQAILSKVVIDSSGDGDIAARAGAAYEKGNPENSLLQPPTLLFKASNVDMKQLFDDVDKNPENYHIYSPPHYGKFYKEGQRMVISGCEQICNKAKQAGDYDVPNPYIILTCLPNEGDMLVNMAKIKGIDGTDNTDLVKAEIQGTANISKVMSFLRKYIIGFANAFVDWIAPSVGIRETRRIVGEYMLNEQDMASRVKFEDRICMGGRYVDIHDPTPDSSGESKYITCPEGYFIPYRCLVPKDIDNLLVAGRCISVSYVAYGSTRVMAQCMATGQAAGTAAALAVRENTSLRKLDIKKLQDMLRRDKAIID